MMYRQKVPFLTFDEILEIPKWCRVFVRNRTEWAECKKCICVGGVAYELKTKEMIGLLDTSIYDVSYSRSDFMGDTTQQCESYCPYLDGFHCLFYEKRIDVDMGIPYKISDCVIYKRHIEWRK